MTKMINKLAINLLPCGILTFIVIIGFLYHQDDFMTFHIKGISSRVSWRRPRFLFYENLKRFTNNSGESNVRFVIHGDKNMYISLRNFTVELNQRFQNLLEVEKDEELILKMQKEVDEHYEIKDLHPYSLKGLSTCKSQQNIVFLKTHKTGSSTMANILNRFADINNLRMLLPKGKANRFFWPAIFSGYYVDTDFLDKKDQYKANILVNHARLNKTEMSYFFPADVKFISLLRHPTTNLESVYYYQKYDKTFQRFENQSTSLKFSEFLEAPMRYLQKALENKNQSAPLLHNGMLYDLGLNFYNETHYNDSLINQTVQKLDRELDLVLIMEHFDESLVLMKRIFCWTFEDILYLKHNQRNPQRKTYTMNSKLFRKIKNWNRADLLLYQHFNKTLWFRIDKHGKPFWEDLKYFRTRLRQLHNECDVRLTNGVAHNTEDTKVIKFIRGDNVEPLRTPFCNMVFRSEVEYLDKFRRQYDLELISKIRKAKKAELERRQKEQRKRRKRTRVDSSRAPHRVLRKRRTFISKSLSKDVIVI